MIQYKKYLSFFFILNLILFTGCVFQDYESVEIFLPEENMTLVYFDFCGEVQKKFCSGKKAVLNLKKNSVSGIMAFENLDEDSVPFGAVYPYEIKVNQKDGFASKVVFLLTEGSSSSYSKTLDFLNKFNWGKFMQLCREVENPWEFNMQNVMEKIASGRFRKSDLK